MLPWRISHLGGAVNTLIGVHLRRPLLRRRLHRVTEGQPDDVTVIVAHRNRADYRLRNALRSIQEQAYPAGGIRILVVDYGSDPQQLERLLAIAEPLAVECLPVRGQGNWNRAHCLNIGIKRAQTKFVMVTDVDVMLARNYLAEAIAALHRDPLSAVFAPCVHLPESCAGHLEAASLSPGWLDLEALKLLGRIKTADAFSPGMVATYTHFLHEIRGYDEFYHTYGAEDSDVAQRFLSLGLRHVSIADRTFYLHQWHVKFEGVRSDSLQQTIQRNVQHFKSTHSIKRNAAGWGDATGQGRSATEFAAGR